MGIGYSYLFSPGRCAVTGKVHITLKIVKKKKAQCAILLPASLDPFNVEILSHGKLSLSETLFIINYPSGKEPIENI